MARLTPSVVAMVLADSPLACIRRASHLRLIKCLRVTNSDADLLDANEWTWTFGL